MISKYVLFQSLAVTVVKKVKDIQSPEACSVFCLEPEIENKTNSWIINRNTSLCRCTYIEGCFEKEHLMDIDGDIQSVIDMANINDTVLFIKLRGSKCLSACGKVKCINQGTIPLL